MRTSFRRLAVVVTAGVGLAITAVGAAGAAAGTTVPNAQDREFLVAAHQSNLTEIAAGRAAQQKATTDVVRQHGQIFIRDHTRLDASLRQVAQQLNVDLPGEPNAQQRATLASVSAKSGAAFDQAWLASQLAGHRAAKALGQRELANGSDAAVLRLARTAAPVIQTHLSMLEEATGTAPSGADAGTGGQAATAPVGMRTGWVLVGIGILAAAGTLAVLRPRRSTTG
jgi:putative membrane protein